MSRRVDLIRDLVIRSLERGESVGVVLGRRIEVPLILDAVEREAPPDRLTVARANGRERITQGDARATFATSDLFRGQVLDLVLVADDDLTDRQLRDLDAHEASGAQLVIVGR